MLPIESLAEVAARALNVLMAPREGLPVVPELPRESLPDLQAWESITRSRRPERPGVRALLKLGASDVVPLHGTGQGEQDPGLLIALARFGGAPCVVLGQDRRHQTMDHPLGPAGLREARRGMRLAHELKLPLVSVIDTAGAALSKEAEEGGLAGEIARCLAELVMLDAPTVCVLLGQGTGGGALALMPADRVICAQHSWLSPLPPEGASAILYRDTDHAPELAASQGVRSLDLLRDGIVDRIVAEHPDAADEPADFCARMAQVLEHELALLLRADPVTRPGRPAGARTARWDERRADRSVTVRVCQRAGARWADSPTSRQAILRRLAVHRPDRLPVGHVNESRYVSARSPRPGRQRDDRRRRQRHPGRPARRDRGGHGVGRRPHRGRPRGRHHARQRPAGGQPARQERARRRGRAAGVPGLVRRPDPGHDRLHHPRRPRAQPGGGRRVPPGAPRS